MAPKGTTTSSSSTTMTMTPVTTTTTATGGGTKILESGELKSRKQEILLRISVLALLCVLAFSTRLFSVLRYESVIHEFDPWFNFRTTKVLVEKGWYEFYNWFDSESWYPLGRIVGGTVYPGLMFTSAIIYWALQALNITVDIRNVCVMLAPLFASFTVIVTYLIGKEVRDSSAGLVAAAFISIVPGYISRSVAGSYDNEGVAIFALLFTFYLWIKSVKTGSILWTVLTCLGYFYMVNAWGGYIFIINIIPIYVFVMIITGRYSERLYVAYSVFYILGTLLSMQVRFVGFQAVQSSEHMAAMGIFVLLQIYHFVNWIRSQLDPQLFRRFLRLTLSTVLIVAATVLALGVATGYISPWTGRFWTLLDPTYAKKHIPIIASVSEHQPTTWASFFFDLHILAFLFPVGLYYSFQDLTDGGIFILLYGIASVYFAGVMVRLMLVLAPAACILSAIGVSQVLKTYTSVVKSKESSEASPSSSKKSTASTAAASGSASSTSTSPSALPSILSWVMIFFITLMLFFYILHCTWVTSEAYSSPSIVLAARGHGGQKIIFDDFREAYWWLNMNTAPDAKIMSWWDYGYQISGMGNRTVIVDNNTWNNTHIATVGKAMSSNEEEAFKIMKRLDVDYVLVIFGGITGYASDDINKFLWMVRIAGSVDPSINEIDYFSKRGEYRIDTEGSARFLNCLMYKLSYYRFGEMMTDYHRPAGYDRVRQATIGNKDISLEHLEEAFSSEHYIVRIYKVKKEASRE